MRRQIKGPYYRSQHTVVSACLLRVLQRVEFLSKYFTGNYGGRQKGDATRYSERGMLAPNGCVLVNFLDPCTRLSRLENLPISNDEFTLDMMTYRRHPPMEKILTILEVKEQLRIVQEHKELVEMQIRRCTIVNGNPVIVDLSDEHPIFVHNRLILRLF